LTPGKSLPMAAEFLLGFGLKFIPIPKNPFKRMITMKASIILTLTCSLKLYFAGDDEDDKPYEKL
jgi:hypothetical protein